MVRSPGKQIFIDDYFIESLDGARRHDRSRPCRQLPAATRLPSCAQNFFAQSLVNSRELSSISRTCFSACATPPSAAKGPPARPVLTHRDHTRGLRQPPVCRVAPKISHPISHNLS